MVLESYVANDYVRALVIFVVLLIVLRLLASIVTRVVLRLTRKTKTELDDVMVRKSSVPITMILFFVSVKFAINELVMSEVLARNVDALIYTGVVIFVGYLVYVIVDVLVFEAWTKLAKKAKLGAGESLASLIHGGLKIVLVVLVLLYILDLWGFEITPLLAGLGLVGLAVALALQPLLGNVFAGVAIVSDKTIRIGDLVYLDATTRGKINKIGLRSTRIVTFDNEMIIVPNSMLADSKIQNIALPDPKSRVVIPFGVAYGSDVEKVKKIVVKEIKSIEVACKDPEPVVRFIEMGDSALMFKAYYYVDSFEDRFASKDEANTKIYNALNKNKISIPFPQVDVHLKKG